MECMNWYRESDRQEHYSDSDVGLVVSIGTHGRVSQRRTLHVMNDGDVVSRTLDDDDDVYINVLFIF